MTEAIVSAVVNKLEDLLLGEEVRSLRGLDRKLDEVKAQLGKVQHFLKDADSKKTRGDERIKEWVHAVRDLAYEIEDALDKYVVEANYRRFGLIPNGPLARRTLGEKISKIQAKLSLITEFRSTLGIKDLGEDSGHSESVHLKQPSFKRHGHPDADVIGFEAEKSDIINLLLKSPNDQSWFVVSIVGPGGLGKTTLARKVYTSSDVKNHFDSCIWITVSQDFHLLDALKKMHRELANGTELKRVRGALNEIHQDDQIDFLFREVNTLLKKKKYLIVLDDVWTEVVFTQLETGLVNIGNGSRVLMTTRNLNVANYANSSGVYPLKFLSEGESIGLFLKKALQSSSSSPECPEELKDIAIGLVKRCNGLPLALIVLGSLVSSKDCTAREWCRMRERLDWHVVGQGECMKVLAASYDDLSYLHKSCFRYVACFPEDYEIRAGVLMKMWIAEGLIEVENEGQLEDYAEDYLEELVQRCLLQVVERSPDGSIKSIRVHDLLREVALREATENDFLLIWKEENAERDVSRTRQVVFHQGTDESTSIYPPKDFAKFKMSKLRTFINFENRDFRGIGFLLLKVLELKSAIINYLPTDLKNMIHLRYLGLRDTQVCVIPSWIGHLQNLQTFDIRGTVVKRLPQSFWNITSLRHVLTSTRLKLEGPPSTANLVNLRSLGHLLVPKSWKKNIPNLFGVRKLKLGFENENDGMVIHDLISKLNNLHSVKFGNFYLPRGTIDFSTSPSYEKIHTMYLTGMDLDIFFTIAEMPRNLTKLTLNHFSLNGDPMPKLGKLRCLKYLELCYINTKADTIVCTDGGFPRLQILKLYVWKMKEWKVKNGACPVLKYLLIDSCNELSALPNLQCVKTLQELVINDYELQSKIKNMSGEEWHKVKHIPTITLNQKTLL